MIDEEAYDLLANWINYHNSLAIRAKFLAEEAILTYMLSRQIQGTKLACDCGIRSYHFSVWKSMMEASDYKYKKFVTEEDQVVTEHWLLWTALQNTTDIAEDDGPSEQELLAQMKTAILPGLLTEARGVNAERRLNEEEIKKILRHQSSLIKRLKRQDPCTDEILRNHLLKLREFEFRIEFLPAIVYSLAEFCDFDLGLEMCLGFLVYSVTEAEEALYPLITVQRQLKFPKGKDTWR